MMQITKVYRLLLAALVSLLLPLAAGAEGAHWNQNTTSAPSSSPYLTVGNPTELDQNRPLEEDTGGFLKFTDNGAKMPFTLEFDTTALPITRGGTGAATQQAALNALMSLAGVATGDIIVFNGTNWVLKHQGANGTFWGVSGGVLDFYTPAGSGTVTSVGLSVPSWLSVGGTPVTGSGTLAVSNGTGLSADRVVGTNGSGALDLMALTAAQVPNLDAAKITSGALAKAQQHANTVYNDAGNAYSGTATQDMSASGQTLLIPIKASGGTTGEINLNSTDLEFRSAGVTHKAAKQATTITAGTGLSGGGDLSTGRTLNISTVPLANGGSNADLSGASTGAVIYKGASALTSLTPVASKLIGFDSGGTAITTYNQAAGFGGDGNAGAVTKGAVTETTRLQLNATDFTQTVSTTWKPLSGTIVNATTTCAFNGTITVGTGPGGGAGGNATNYTGADGSGLGGGKNGGLPAAGYPAGGGGGANAGAGGAGATQYQSGASAYPISSTGGSGGAGGCYDAAAAGGAGGAGGGCFIGCSVGAMTVGASGAINADGTAGANGAGGSTGDGGGGGSGGTVSLNSQTSIANSGNVRARGGNGGNGGFGGGTGGGGYIQFLSPSNTNGTRTVTAGATVGTGGTASAGAAGLAVSITATPNLPLLLSMQEDNFARMKSIALAHRVLNFPTREGFDVELTMREAATACSRGSVIQFAKLVDGNMEESTCIEIGDSVEALDNAA